MHDLRKQVLLESGKTVSRRARSRQVTPSGSQPNSGPSSPQESQASSANPSDGEEDISDPSKWTGLNNIDALLAALPDSADTNVWVATLLDQIDILLDRKGSSVQSREDNLMRFIHCLRMHYAQVWIKNKVNEILTALMKSATSGASENESLLGLKAVSMVSLTTSEFDNYERIMEALQKLAADAQSSEVKIASIQTVTDVAFYAGASADEDKEVMEFMLEVVSSDGATLDAADNGPVVAAALESWGVLASQNDDLSEVNDEAMEAFVDQLESTDVDVQIAAGYNIALLFAACYTPQEDDDDIPNPARDIPLRRGGWAIQRWVPYRRQNHLEETLRDLVKTSSRRIARRHRRALHVAFTDVLRTVENPLLGPRYSTALDEDGHELGSRLKIAINDSNGNRDTIVIDTWWKFARLASVRRLLQSGLQVHYQHNRIIQDSLPTDLYDGR